VIEVRRISSRLGVIIVLTVIASCSMTRPVEIWTDTALEIRKLEDREQFDEAAERYAVLLQDAPSDSLRRWVEFRQAEILREKQDFQAALTAYERIWTTDKVDEWGSRSMFQSAMLNEDLGDRHESTRLLLKTVFKYPDEISADNALHEIYRRFEPTPRALDAILGDMAPYLSHTMLAGNVLFLKAQNQDKNLQDIGAAAKTYRRIYMEFPEDAIADDALWEMTNLYRRVQDWPSVIQNLKVFANNTESSWFIGSYDSEFVDNAIFELGEINMLFVEDYDEAVYWFERFADSYDDSLRAPKALYFAAEARRLQHADHLHFAALKDLIRRYPESKWAAKASDRLGSAGVQP
jgi:TolA-binding protein